MGDYFFSPRFGMFSKLLCFCLAFLFCLGPLHAAATSETKDFIPQVLTFTELKKLSPQNRALYLKTLREALQEIEELHQNKTKDPKKSKPTSAHNNSPHFPLRDTAILLSLLTNPAWANSETHTSTDLTCPNGYDRGQDSFGDIRCFRKELSEGRRRPECRSNENSAGIAWIPEKQRWERTCWVNPIKQSPSGPPSPPSPPAGNSNESDCTRAGGSFSKGVCTCGERYTYRAAPPRCTREKGSAGCFANETEEGDLCVVRPPAQPPAESCVPQQCTVNREVQNDYSQKFRERPTGGGTRRCINAGMVTDYDHDNPHCPRVPRAEMGGFRTEDCPARHTICNPLIFGLLPGNKPLCVPVGWATTRRCDQESRKQNALDIFTSRPPTLTEDQLRREWDKFREEFKSLCVDDDTSRNFHCVECGVIARRNAEFLRQMGDQTGGSSVKRNRLCGPTEAPRAPTPRAPERASGRP